MHRPSLWGSLAGIAVGTVIAAGLVTTGHLVVPPHRGDTDASASFLRAWERSRRGTFVVESDFRRTLRDGRTLYSASEVAQRPPDRVVRQFGGITGTVGGHALLCSTDATGAFNCFEATAPARSYDEELRDELDTMASYFRSIPLRLEDPGGGTVAPSGTDPAPPALYRVVDGEPGCFELSLQLNYPDPEYGTRATFCFDEPTGALRSLERELSNGTVERTEARSISTTVLPSDLEATQRGEFDTRFDLPPAEPVIVQPPAGSVPPGATPTRDELTAMPTRTVVARAGEAASAGGDLAPYVAEIVGRMTVGGVSINDEIWLGPDGRPTPLGTALLTELLRIGYMAPVPRR